MQSQVTGSKFFLISLHFMRHAAHLSDPGDLTWGCLTLSNEKGALRVPGSEEEPHGFVSRDVLEEPPAAQAHDRGF